MFRRQELDLLEKLLNVAGMPLSLDDIQFTILCQNYDNDPLIIYGLYQGIVGAPDIRTSAYTGDDVYRALEENADIFINSNRGTLVARMISSRYRASMTETGSTSPISVRTSRRTCSRSWREGTGRTRGVDEIEPDIDDWTMTDMGGTVPVIGR